MKLSEAQKKVMNWIGQGWTGEPGVGASIHINGKRVCNVDTMMVLLRSGLAQKDSSGRWTATETGKDYCKQIDGRSQE